MRSAVRRATLVTTAISAMVLLAACSSTTGSATASSGSVGTPTAPSASASTRPGVAGTAQSDPTQGDPTTPAAPTHVASAPAAAPVLGTVWASGVQGYGHARPTGLSSNGDPTGIVTSLSWSSWGGASATGTGSAEYVAVGQSVAQGSEQPAKVVAFDLGLCNGKRAYRAIEWYFPGEGQHFDPTRYFDACTGQDHGM